MDTITSFRKRYFPGPLIKVAVYLFPFLILTDNAIGQANDFSVEDFYITGDAIFAGDRCFQLTEANRWNGGALWFKRKVDLTEAFEMELNLSFGCNDDEGADGIVFIFHPYLTTGFAGEGMGFGGLYPSFGIEMDTYQNYHLSDPTYDHVALMQQGSLNHAWGLTAPVTLMDGVMNIEDCKYQKVKISWDPIETRIRFYFNGSLRINENIDLVNTIFDGIEEVFWGFTSATGAKVNRHMVCLDKLTFTETFALSKKDKSLIIDGQGYTFKNINFSSGSTVLPQRAKSELDAFIPFFKEHPTHSIILEAYTDSSGNANRNLQLSESRAKAIFQYLKDKGINAERIIYYGHGEKNPIAPNTSELGRKKNRRVELRMRVIRV